MRHATQPGVAIALLLASTVVAAVIADTGHFGEGYSSATQTTPAEIHYRMLSLGNWQQICDASALPDRLSLKPDPLRLNIGERIHRSGAAELVIEAYDAQGRFVPRVPILLVLIDPQDITTSRSDWDFFEAKQPGEAWIGVRSACAKDIEPSLEFRARIIVTGD